MDNIPDIGTTAFQRLTVGNFALTVVSDGYAGFAPELYGVNAPEGAIDALMDTNNLPRDVVASAANTLLIETGDKRVLVDTGWGSFTMEDTPMHAGRMLATLLMLGVEPEHIDAVILTHFHPDHIAMISRDGKPTFPGAQVFFPQAEQDFLAQGNTGTPLDPFIELANTKLQPLKDNDQLALYGDEDEMISGIQAIATPGHSPGHHSLLIADNGQQFLHMVDIANHFLISLAHPDYHFGFDAMPDDAVETRRALLSRAADEKLQVMAYHFPFPGVGYIARNRDGFRFLPTV